MFSSGIAGSGLRETNIRFRMYLVAFAGIFAFGSVLYWRAQLMINSSYVEFPEHGQTIKRKRAALMPEMNINYKQLNEME